MASMNTMNVTSAALEVTQQCVLLNSAIQAEPTERKLLKLQPAQTGKAQTTVKGGIHMLFFVAKWVFQVPIKDLVLSLQ